MRTRSNLAVGLLIGMSIYLPLSVAADDGVKNAQPAQSAAQSQQVNNTVFMDTQAKGTTADTTSGQPQHPKKPGAFKKVIKGLESELGSEASGMGKDLMFVFSVKDFDPYEEKPPKNQPYVIGTIEYVDGSEASVIHNTDGTLKLLGGFADGTILTPLSPTVFAVRYPNGATGKLEKSGDGYKVYRSDNTITSITKTASGDFSISNDKLGYMGTAVPADRTGLNYSMKDLKF